MDFTEGFNFEVSVINLEENGYSYAKQDNDCTIIEPETSQEKRKHNRNNAHNNQAVTKKCNGESIPIVIDEDSDKDNESTVIDLDKIDENVSHTVNCHSKSVFSYDGIYKDNKHLIELIEKCLDMENSTGMLRIINRTLVPIYKDADETYKKSDEFNKIISQKIMKLDTEPERKFSHLKDLCEQLKAYKTKKRVSFVTLKTNLNGKLSKSNTKLPDHDIPPKKIKNYVIDLDDDDDDVVCSSVTDIKIVDVRSQIADNDSSPVQVNNNYNNHIVIDDTETDNEIQINEIDSQGLLHEKDDGIKSDSDDQTNNGTKKNGTDNDNVLLIVGDVNENLNKEEETVLCTSVMNAKSLVDKRDDKVINIDLSNEDEEIDNSSKIDNSKESSNCMGNKRRVSFPVITSHTVEAEIERLEYDLAKYNKLILDLEEQEVFDDMGSPYIESEFYKKKVVEIYKKLCELTNTESVKHHTVRLTVAPGHPEGPVKYLEQYINDNIDENGNPLFPDLHDVVDCVCKANAMYKMGWSKREIEKEARALFIHYGRTVQKRRQKREWRHMMLYVKQEAPDPADEDLALQARLEENARLAKTNEDELINRYAQMENSYLIPEQDLRLIVDNNSESDQDSDYESTSSITKPNATTSPTAGDASGTNIARIILNSFNQGCTGNITENIHLHNSCMQPVSLNSQSESAKLTTNQNLESSTVAQERTSNGAESSRCDITDSKESAVSEISNVSNKEISEVSSSNINPNSEAKGIDEASVETCHSYTISYIEDETDNSEVLECVNNNSTVMLECVNNNNTEMLECVNNNNSEVLESVNNNNSEEKTDARTSQTDNSVLVKKEPLDIPRMLEQLGSDYTATVIDIEDPFLVIEISDSSDDESDDDYL